MIPGINLLRLGRLACRLQPTDCRVRRDTGRGTNLRAQPHLATADDTALLGALPIAAAVVTRLDDGTIRVLAHNSRFDETVAQSTCTALEWDEADCLQGRPDRRIADQFLRRHGRSRASSISATATVSPPHYFRIKLAPLPRGHDSSPRCLLSVVDRTVEVQAERSLRAEMLRDSLTGLPNRLAFTEEDRTGRRLRLRATASMRCWWSTCCASARINESMGSLAGDELLITFARRLILALRGGDVLARTGGNEFGVLVSLRRGVEDALKAAERIQEVMLTPFKLSDLEIRDRMRDRASR